VLGREVTERGEVIPSAAERLGGLVLAGCVKPTMEPVTSVRPRGCDFDLEVPTRNRSWYEVDGYEPYTTTLFRTVCASADVIIDIGAHVGYYAVVGARANPRARVIAVEASPQNSAVLSRNVEAALPSTVEVLNAAFSDAEGTVWLELSEASDNCGLTPHPNSPTVERVQVPAITGSSLTVPPGRRVVVKIDIEGHELSALQGLEPLLQGSADSKLFIELNPKCLRGAGQTPDRLLAWLLDHGFRVFALDEHAWTWSELRTATSWMSVADEESYTNLYCLPKGMATTVSAVLHSANLAGAERSHVEMVQDLVAGGFMVHTVMPEPDQGLAEQARRAGSSVTLVEPMPWWMTPADAPPVDTTVGSWVHAPLVDVLARAQADVVLTQTGVLPQGAIAAAILDIPHVWYLHEFGDLDHGLRLPAPPGDFGRLVAGLSDAVITNSRAVRERFYPNDAGAATVIHPAPRIAPSTERVEREWRPWTLGIVAPLQPGKGHGDAIAAVAELRGSGFEVPLVLLGSGTAPERDRLVALAYDQGVADLVTFAGAVVDQVDLYARIDAVAVTSRSEAFGRVPFEATAAGLPVIYASAGGLLEYMRPGVTGLPYSSGDTHGLAEAIRSLASDEELQGALVANARAEFAKLVEEQARRSELQLLLRGVRRRQRPKPFQALVKGLGTATATALAQRDALAVERDNARAQRDALAVERDNARAQRDALAVERDNARAQRDALAVERDDALAQRDALAVKWDIALAQRDDAVMRAGAIEGSRTWRYTSWYRGVRARLRRL
jgi:FkbM family methyltransferase